MWNCAAVKKWNRSDALSYGAGGCLFTQSHADHVIGLQDATKGHCVLMDTGTYVLKAGGVCAPPQVRKLYK